VAKPSDLTWIRFALRLARKATGETSPNPMVGAVLIKEGQEIGLGWHHRAGLPHAEIEALRDARSRGNDPTGATLYVTLEPCSTHGRTPPCTEAILEAGITRVVVAATDPNPRHAGRGIDLLRNAGVEVITGIGSSEANLLNRGFNHWIVHKTPWVTLKAGMTLDGKIATASGESKWITGPESRKRVMQMRRGNDAILVGIGTVLADNPALTVRQGKHPPFSRRRVILDTQARTPLTCQLTSDHFREKTVIVVGEDAPKDRREALAQQVQVWVAPCQQGHVDLRWLLSRLGGEGVTSLLVEGGGEVHSAFISSGLAHQVAFFYAPLILGGEESIRAVGGQGAASLAEASQLADIRTTILGEDLLLEAMVIPPQSLPSPKS
jgi:diaminohydroxyphosphoribosylaminopyrimidine deaminase/5-amino-6-(5-phosphoribosylamino)uracil reductase